MNEGWKKSLIPISYVQDKDITQWEIKDVSDGPEGISQRTIFVGVRALEQIAYMGQKYEKNLKDKNGREFVDLGPGVVEEVYFFDKYGECNNMRSIARINNFTEFPRCFTKPQKRIENHTLLRYNGIRLLSRLEEENPMLKNSLRRSIEKLKIIPYVE